MRNEPCSFPTDIYSMGCTLFQFLVGLPPFQAGSEYLVMIRVMNKDLKFPAGVSKAVRALVKWCTEPAAAERPSLFDVRRAEWLNHPAGKEMAPHV